MSRSFTKGIKHENHMTTHHVLLREKVLEHLQPCLMLSIDVYAEASRRYGQEDTE